MKSTLTVALLLLFTNASASTSELESSKLTIRVVDLIPGSGPAILAIFDSAATYESRTTPLRSHSLVGDNEVTAWHLDHVPAGDYAVIVFQDLNANGVLDRGRLGIPKEPFGFSNGVRPMGPPSFDQARFHHDGGVGTIEIRLVRRSKKSAPASE